MDERNEKGNERKSMTIRKERENNEDETKEEDQDYEQMNGSKSRKMNI